MNSQTKKDRESKRGNEVFFFVLAAGLNKKSICKLRCLFSLLVFLCVFTVDDDETVIRDKREDNLQITMIMETNETRRRRKKKGKQASKYFFV